VYLLVREQYIDFIMHGATIKKTQFHDFKLSPNCECCILSFGFFSRRLTFLCAQVSERSACSITPPMKMVETLCSETSAQAPGCLPKEGIQHAYATTLVPKQEGKVAGTRS
jgi:hypothetical protein